MSFKSTAEGRVGYEYWQLRQRVLFLSVNVQLNFDTCETRLDSTSRRVASSPGGVDPHYRLFKHIVTNPQHCFNSTFPPVRSCDFGTRDRCHPYEYLQCIQTVVWCLFSFSAHYTVYSFICISFYIVYF